MKIACENCGTKYSIDDEKLKGKVFKIRCKKCSNVIVAKGTPGDVDPAAKERHTFDDDADGADDPDRVWHLVINGEQAGPFTLADVEAKLKAGTVDDKTFAWKDGLDDWKPMSEVEGLAATLAAAQKAAPVAAAKPAEAKPAPAAAEKKPEPKKAEPKKDDVDSMFGDMPPPEDKEEEDEPAASKPAEDEGDMFGDIAVEAPKAAAKKAPEPEVSTEPGASKLKGERSEDSILFSLGNLASLADGGSSPAPSR